MSTQIYNNGERQIDLWWVGEKRDFLVIRQIRDNDWSGQGEIDEVVIPPQAIPQLRLLLAERKIDG